MSLELTPTPLDFKAGAQYTTTIFVFVFLKRAERQMWLSPQSGFPAAKTPAE